MTIAAIIEEAAFNHNVSRETIATELTIRGWEFRQINLIDPGEAHFVRTVINEVAANLASTLAKVEDRKKKPRVWLPSNTCGKCLGTGKVWATWIANGVCFQCDGLGIIRKRAK
jgi:CO/xanthine dehydrogenase Mo-binding subunit